MMSCNDQMSLFFVSGSASVYMTRPLSLFTFPYCLLSPLSYGVQILGCERRAGYASLQPEEKKHECVYPLQTGKVALEVTTTTGAYLDLIIPHC